MDAFQINFEYFPTISRSWNHPLEQLHGPGRVGGCGLAAAGARQPGAGRCCKQAGTEGLKGRAGTE